MRKLVLSFIIAVLSAVVVSATDNAVVYNDGDRGEFQYPFASYKHDFAVMKTYPSCSDNAGGKYGTVGGTITASSVVKVVNRNGITKENLDLLSGKEVVVIGKFRSEGKGEGMKVYCLSLTILVVEPVGE